MLAGVTLHNFFGIGLMAAVFIVLSKALAAKTPIQGLQRFAALGFVHNLPPAGAFVESTDTFFRTTERNDIPQQSQAYPGLGGNPVDFRIPNVGVLGTIRVQQNLTLVIGGAGAVTANYPFP